MSLVLTLGFVLTLAAQRRSAELRHLIWSSAFAVALATPLLAAFGPKLLKPPSLAKHAARAAARIGIASSGIVSIAAAPSPETVTQPFSIPYPELLVGIWAAGVLVLGIRMFRGTRRANAFRKAAVPLEIFEGVPVAESESAAVAMTLGVSAPLIVLPLEHRNWSDQRRWTVLTHELAHVRRRDCMVQWLPRTVRALYWFNPIVWLASSQMLCEAERACDDAVIASGANGPDFARDLLDIADAISQSGRLNGTDPMMITVATRLERRIARLLDPAANRKPLTRTRAVASAASALVLLLPLAGVRAQENTPGAPGGTPGGTTAQTAAISGIVSDPSGARVPNAAINLYSSALYSSVIPSGRGGGRGAGNQNRPDQSGPGKLALTADRTGAWTAAGLLPGAYQLEVLMPGFATYRQNVNLAGGAALQLRQNLSIGQTNELITVAAAGTPRPAAVSAAGTQVPNIGGLVQASKLISRTPPAYPGSLRQQGVEGTVLIQAIIGKTGFIVNARLANDQAPPELADAALAAVRTWQYEPALLNGMPVEAITTITVDFRLK